MQENRIYCAKPAETATLCELVQADIDRRGFESDLAIVEVVLPGPLETLVKTKRFDAGPCLLESLLPDVERARIAVTEWAVGGWPSIAPKPADRTRKSPRPATARRNSASAIGLRQTLPVQMNKMVFIPPNLKIDSQNANRQPEIRGVIRGRSQGL